MRVLALDAALARCGAAIVVDQNTLALRHEDAVRGHAALLPVMASTGLDEAKLRAPALDLGGGVTVGEALADPLPRLGERRLWSAIDSRRGRIFLEQDGAIFSCLLDLLPPAQGKVAVAGDAAIAVASRLAARDADVMLTDARLPQARHIAVVGERRFAGLLAHLPAQPLYVDPPEARLPAGGLGPAPPG